MKVILVKDVPGLGRAGDVKEVSDGHARNLLIPRHMAMPATSSALTRIQKEQKEQQAKVLRHQQEAQALKNKLDHKTFIIKGKAEKQHLFAAIREAEIASALSNKFNLTIDPKQIKIEKPIKSLGSHEVEIKLAENIHAKVKIEVQAQ